MRLSQRPVCGIQTGDRSWTTVTIRQFKVMAAKRHNNQVTGLPSLVGTYLSVGGLWRVTAVSVGRARASNLLKFHAAGSRRHLPAIDYVEPVTLKPPQLCLVASHTPS